MKIHRKQIVNVFGQKQLVDVPVDDELYKADNHKSERSGLVQTVNYAIKKNLHITFIHPDTAHKSDYMPI